MADDTADDTADARPPDGLKPNAIGFVDALVIGLNATSPPTPWRRSSARSWHSWASTPPA